MRNKVNNLSLGGTVWRIVRSNSKCIHNNHVKVAWMVGLEEQHRRLSWIKSRQEKAGIVNGSARYP